MSQRPGILVSAGIDSPRPPWPHPGLPDPRSEVARISAEVRAHWPPWASRADVMEAIWRAHAAAIAAAHDAFEAAGGDAS